MRYASPGHSKVTRQGFRAVLGNLAIRCWNHLVFEERMTNSLALYRPSILELAQEGNFRAIAFWINSLLGPYGIYIRATPSRSGQMNILVDFKQSRRREFYIALRKHLVRFICYRLWTLNSEKIRDVRIIARIAGEQDILWKQSIRIVTPANRETLRQPRRGKPTSLRQFSHRGIAWIRFLIMRSTAVSRLAVASFFLCYWLMYWDAAGKHIAEQSLTAMASSAIEQPVDPSSEKGQLRAGAPSTPESGLVVLARQIQQDLVQQIVAERFVGQTVYQVKPADGEKVIALTFDDGPWQNTTEQVLDILKENDIKATFFWVGQALQQNPDIARKVVAAGHAVGNHTWRHPMETVNEVTAAEEINNTARLIYETTGLRTNLFRPPGGNLEGAMVPYAKTQKHVVTMWSAESDDYYVSAPIIVDNVLQRAQPGGIVLMHDGGGDRTETVKALPQIITALKQQGYRFVTVPELLATQAKEERIVQPPSTDLADPTPFAPGSPPPEGASGAGQNPAISPAPTSEQMLDPDYNPFSSFQEDPVLAPTTSPSPDLSNPVREPQQNPFSPTGSSVPGTGTSGIEPQQNGIEPQQNPLANPTSPLPEGITGTPSEIPTTAPLNQMPTIDRGLTEGSEDTLARVPQGDLTQQDLTQQDLTQRDHWEL